MKKISFVTTILVTLIFMSTLSAQNTKNTTVDFKIKNIGVYVKGNFSKAIITSNFDENNLSNSFINAVITIKSISTKNNKRDKHLLESEYFDAQKYPEMKLVSTKIEKISNDNYRLTGKLTIKNKSKTVRIPLTMRANGQAQLLESNFELNRRDYGVGGSSWILSNTVKINVKHTLKK